MTHTAKSFTKVAGSSGMVFLWLCAGHVVDGMGSAGGEDKGRAYLFQFVYAAAPILPSISWNILNSQVNRLP
jgi:hypothetical protein